MSYLKTSEDNEQEEDEFYNGEEYSYEYEVGSCCNDSLMHCGKLQFNVMIGDVGQLEIWSAVVAGAFLLTALSNS